MIWLLIQSDIEFQNLVLFFLIGFGTTASLGVFSNPYRLQEASITISSEVIMLFILISSLIIALPAFIDIDHIIKLNPKLVFYSSLLIIVILTLFQLFLYLVNYGYEITFIIVLLLMISIILTILLVYRRNKKYLKQTAAIQKSSEESQMLTAFSKPKKVLEEEVTVSKEKKICIVCKGKVKRENVYLCPECDTFYCKKCAGVLATLENACWVCDTPIDETKPVSLQKEEEREEVTIEDTIHKQKKKKN